MAISRVVRKCKVPNGLNVMSGGRMGVFIVYICELRKWQSYPVDVAKID